MNSNLKAFLLLIRECEGTADSNGYRRRHNGNRSIGVLFDSFEKHPCVLIRETNSSAAGAYQITCSTWKKLQVRLKLKDFSPPNQDAAAIELINEKRGAMDDIITGTDFTIIDMWTGTHPDDTANVWRIRTGKFNGTTTVWTRWDSLATISQVYTKLQADLRFTAKLAASPTIDLPVIAAHSEGSGVTVTVTGALTTDNVIINSPNIIGIMFKATVTATNTVTIYPVNITAQDIDPPPNSFRVMVLR